MNALLLKLRSWWEAADKTQKSVTIFGSLFLVLLLGGTFYFASKPKMARAFSGLDSQEVGTVTDEITKLGIPVQYDTQGNVEVPTDKVAEVKAKLAVAGKLPSAGHQSSAELSNIGIGSSEKVQDARMRSILEDEIGSSIERIKGIQKARVHITPGSESAFASESKPPTASVVLTVDTSDIFRSEQGHSVAMLVANAVNGLAPEKVFVMDETGRSLWDGNQINDGTGQASQLVAAQTAEQSRRERELQAALDSAFGRGNTLVKVNLELSFDKTAQHITEHPESKAVAAVQTKEETYSNGGYPAVPPAGMGANVPGTAAPATPSTPDGKGYMGKVTSKEQPVNTTVTDTEKAIGSIKSMAISALVNTAQRKDDKGNLIPVPKKEDVEQFIVGYLKPWTSDAENGSKFTETVTPTAFDASAQTQASAAEKATASREQMQQIISLLPIGALILVALLIVKTLSKIAKNQAGLAALPNGGVMALMGGHELRGADGEAIHHELGSAEHNALDDIGPIQERLNLPLEQIKRMTEDKSENVAMLIKTWMLEDHR